MRWLRRLTAPFRHRRLEADMAAEMRDHLERLAQQKIDAGMNPDEARYSAQREFGNVPSLQERCRDQHGWMWLEQTWRDVRYAWRGLLKSRTYAVVAVGSLALGIGANTAIFSLVVGVLLGSLPVPHPEQLRALRWSGMEPHIRNYSGSMGPMGDGGTDSAGGESERRTIGDSFSFPAYEALRQQAANAKLAEVVAFTGMDGVNLLANAEPWVGDGLVVSDNLFAMLGLRPALGRLLAPGDDASGAPPLVVISYGCWQREYGGDADVLGRTLQLNGYPFTIVGVTPPEWHGMGLEEQREFYVSMAALEKLGGGVSRAASGADRFSGDRFWIHLLARCRPGATDEQLRAAFDVTFASTAREMMQAPRIELDDGRGGLGYSQSYYRRPLMILLGVVCMATLIACANLAGLSLARGAARAHEFAVRAALGAGRWRLMRQSLVESSLVAAAGGGAGLLLTWWGRQAVSVLMLRKETVLRFDTHLDLIVLGFTLGVTLVTALLTGLLPALKAGRADPLHGLQSGRNRASHRQGAGRLLVSAQIALSVLLLAGAGLYGRSLVKLVTVDPGFATDHLLLFKLNPRAAGLRGDSVAQFYDRVLDSMAKLPGARGAALMHFKLLGNTMSGGTFFTLPAHPELTGERAPGAYRLEVSETFFSTMGIPLLLGRSLEDGDTSGAQRVVVVNEAFVRRFFPGEYPVGQVLRIGDSDWSIVGVCRDAKYASLREEPPPTVYFSFRQAGGGAMYCAVRTTQAPLELVPDARRLVAGIDHNVPLSDISTQEMTRDEHIHQEWTFAILVGSLAGLAVLLASVGLAGLMAFNVAQRSREIGVRMALGATRGDIARAVLRDAATLAGFGAAVGVPAAWALGRVVEKQLYGVHAYDPLALSLAALGLLLVALVAAALPARHATHVDPMVALRAE